MKRFFLFFSLVCIAIGCTVDEQPVTPVQEDEIHPLDKAYVYEAFESKDFWKTLSSFEEMLEACQVPADIARSLTSSALVQTCLNHPLAGSYSAFDNEFQIIELLVNQNNAFKELLIRDDAAQHLVTFYANNPDLSLCKMHFLELLLGSGLFPSVFEKPLSDQLKMATGSQLAYRRMMPKHYSVHSRKTAELLLREIESPTKPDIAYAGNILKELSLSGGYKKTKSSGDYLGMDTLLTPMGSPFFVAYYEDYTPSEVSDQDTYYTTTYPNATLIEHSSVAYNDRSYAWVMQFGGETCWIYNQSSLSYFIEDHSVVEVSSYSQADIIYSSSSDFSGIPTSTSGIVISKWVNGPVMQHALNASPKGNISNCTYYLYDPYGLHSDWSGYITGEDEVYVGSSFNYVYSYHYDYPTTSNGNIVWEVLDSHDDPVSFTLSYSDAHSARIVFNTSGDLIVQCSYSVNNTLLALEQFNVTAELMNLGNSDPNPDEPEME